ncbi:hypothetical protein VOLCADRAFT_96702 [Volvox carteri f. nagariensis]|uniref:LapB rubredoxin metal binding domain-containing protein n=1 Tax=Volvox carteri f. nagariensis TaxID=3068 RepID=D8UAU2_VOLCA|nr:uncharacterized protein VOLCADRAFT_96702 [Volvox carteri f. nagariensis]EFJ43217.1 hypothetical protein VOLCADRAFT_96702 [Volvox carteri f. nagariensis]|eukprot:XP_002955792.1 hypothetical protein VOLCADRAFT_96702 [Volvox carteri f. nagariensis]
MVVGTAGNIRVAIWQSRQRSYLFNRRHQSYCIACYLGQSLISSGRYGQHEVGSSALCRYLPERIVAVHALLGGGTVTTGGGKVRRVYVCSKCGARHGQYHGKCNKCGGFGTIDLEGIVQEPPQPAAAAAATAGGGGGAGVQALERIQQDAASVRARIPPSYDDANSGGGGGGSGDRAVGWVANGSDGSGGGLEDVPLSLRALSQMSAAGRLGGTARIPLSGRTGAEVQRVLGGGVVPGALVLIGGDPGVGKSTLTLQIAAMMAHPEIDFDALEEQRRSDEGEEEDDVRHEYGMEYGTWYGNGHVTSGGTPVGSTATASGDQYGSSYDSRVYGNHEPGFSEGAQEHLRSDRSSYEYGGLSDGVSGAANSDQSRYGWYDSSTDYGGGGAATAFPGSAASTASDHGTVSPPPCRTVLYVTAEETREQVVDRSRRMGLDCCDGVAVLCRSEMGAISRAVLQLRPDAVVMDSINTVYLNNLPQAPGTVTQVDTVLYLEGDVAQSVRLLRVIKNRHGSDAECGVFSMDATGIHAVANSSALFLENRLADSPGRDPEAAEEESGASSVVGVTLQGTRAILVEVQALVSPLGDRAATAGSSALSYRSATGVEKLRLANLCAILDKHVPTLELSCCSVIVNVVGGTQVKDLGHLDVTTSLGSFIRARVVPLRKCDALLICACTCVLCKTQYNQYNTIG